MTQPEVPKTLSVLALDSAGSACSAALLRDGRIAARRYAEMEHGQAEALIPMVQAVMAEAGAAYAALSLIAVTVGPGSYTGVRVGLAAARGLASASGKPLSGVGSFDAALAALGVLPAPVLVVLETRRDDFYARLFGADRMPVTEAQIATEEELARLADGRGPLLLAGDAAPRAQAALATRHVAAELVDGPRHADAAVVARLAAERFAREGRAHPAEPLYLRPADALTPAERAQARAALGVHLVAAQPVHGAVMAELQSRSFDDRWSAAAMTGLLAQPGVAGSVLVLTGAEIPIGYVLWRAAGGEAEILSLAVDARYRRLGHGRRLVDATLADAARAGARCIFLEVGERNRAARALYEHAGFREAGRRPGYYRGPHGAEDALTYRRDLA